MKEISATFADDSTRRRRVDSLQLGSPSLSVDDTLILATKAGDRSAFEGIYEAYFDRVYRYIVVRIGNPADAEDLAADVFLKALEGLGAYQVRGVPFSAWLFRIAHNLVVDHLRRRSRRPTTVLNDSLPLMQDAPDELVTLGLTIAEVMEAMHEITDLQRQVIAMRFGADLSVAETAQAIKKKEGAVKALQHSAIHALRRRLAQRGHTFAS
ncbi:MAG: sigma-70 family RNA polymerase sigma factor [Dehalococcoidia bacterium]